MVSQEDRSYQDFFKEELYGGFVRYLLHKFGAMRVNTILRDDALVTKKGVHVSFRRDFNVFLAHNPTIEKQFIRNHQRFMSLRNIAGGQLAFPIDCKDENLMLKERIRTPSAIPVDLNDAPRSDTMKKSAGPFTGITIKGEWHERKYLLPKRLTVHFKEGYAIKIGKTTLSFAVESRSEAMHILLDRYEKRVAFATIENEEEFCFVKPRNGKRKRNRKLRGKV